jgi:hypothetical protein
MGGWAFSGFLDDQERKEKPRILKISDLQNIPENSSEISLQFLLKFNEFSIKIPSHNK